MLCCFEIAKAKNYSTPACISDLQVVPLLVGCLIKDITATFDYIISSDIMLTVLAHAVVNFAKSAKYKVNRRIVNTPTTGQLAIEGEKEPAHCFAFFSASQKTLKFKLIR